MAPTKLISTSVGFQDPKGTVVANGMLMLTLSQTCTVTASGGQVTTEPIYLNLDANGKITATAIWFNDELSPSGTIYYGKVYATNKTRVIPGLDNLQYSITGGSFDLATAVQSSSASPSYSGAVLLTPTGNQTITTGNLTLATGSFTTTSGNISSGGTLAVTGATTLTGALVSSTSTTSPAFISSTANPAATGLLRGPNNSILVASRNAANNGDIAAVQVSSSNLVTLGSGPFLIPAVSDTAVGKATTDTLTNKTVTGAGSGNAITLLNFQGPAGALTGNSGDQTVYTFTIPANTIQSGKGIRVIVSVLHTTGSSLITYKLKLGSTFLDSPGITSNANIGIENFTYNIFNNVGSQTAQSWTRIGVFITTATPSFGQANGTSAENTANQLVLTWSFNVANTNQITPVQWIVEMIQ